MRAQNKAPAAWQGHSGRSGVDNRIISQSALPDDELRRAICDARALKDAGAWPQARDCVWATYHAWRRARLADNIGTGLAIELLAGDVADLLGESRERCQAVARDVQLGTRSSVMAGELRAQVVALAEPTARTNAASSAIVVRRGGRKYGR